MIAPLEKLIDWSSVQVMTLMMPAKEYDWRLEEALRFLKGPDFVPIDSQAAQVEFNGPVHFRFPTPRPCDFSCYVGAALPLSTLSPPARGVRHRGLPFLGGTSSASDRRNACPDRVVAGGRLSRCGTAGIFKGGG